MFCEEPPKSDIIEDGDGMEEETPTPHEDQMESDLEDFECDEEFEALNNQLDELDRALDSLEQKNDSIHSQLRELLDGSRQNRLEREENSGRASSPAPPAN